MSNTINLSFDDGYKSIMLNDDQNKVIRLNPTDVGFLNRIANFDDTAKSIQDKYGDIDLTTITDLKNLDPKNPDFEKCKSAVENLNKIESSIRELINEIFGYDISSIVFSTESCLSPVSGQPVFLNFMQCIFGYIEQVTYEENKKSEEKISKYKQQRDAIVSMNSGM